MLNIESKMIKIIFQSAGYYIFSRKVKFKEFSVVVCRTTMTFANFIVRPSMVTWILSRVDDIIAVWQRARRFTRAGFTHNLRSWLAFITQRVLYVRLEQSDPLVKVGFVLGNRVIKPLSAVWRDSKKGNDDYPERSSDVFLAGSIIAWC